MGKLTRIVIDPNYGIYESDALTTSCEIIRTFDLCNVKYSAERNREGYVIECDIPYTMYESLSKYDDHRYFKIYPADRIIPILEAIRKDEMGY